MAWRLIRRGWPKVAALVIAVLVGIYAHPCAQAASRPEFQKVEVQNVLRDPRSGQPVVLLSDLGQERGMLIWIGEAEAEALEAAMRQVVHRRPLTHDLLAGILEKLSARLVQVRITELKDNIFYARILLETPQGSMEVDSRPSDAMVLAQRAGTPLMVERSLFEDQSVPLDVQPIQSYGLEVQELTEDLKAALGYEGDGVLVAQVKSGSLADQDGLEREDILVKVAEEPMRRPVDLEEALTEPRGDLKARIFREGVFLDATLRPHSGS